jgi:putative membrane protein
VESDLTHWSVSWVALIGCGAAAACQLAGWRKLRASAGKDQRREALLFYGGLLVLLIGLVSPVGYLSGVYLWVRALQGLLIGIVGPGMIVLGAPWTAFRLAFRRGAGSDPAGSAGSAGSAGALADRAAPDRLAGADRAAGRRPWLTVWPVAAVVVANAVWLAWQFPVLTDAARGSVGLALLEHVSFVAAGLLFWLQLISSGPLRQQTPPLRRMALVVGTVAAWTVFGMMLVFGSGVLYPGYLNSAHHLMTVLDDQQLSGAVWWMGILPPMIVVAVALMMHWLNDEESAELSAGLDRLLTPRRHGWPSRPVIR